MREVGFKCVGMRCLYMRQHRHPYRYALNQRKRPTERKTFLSHYGTPLTNHPRFVSIYLTLMRRKNLPVSGKTLKKTALVVALIIACSGASVECYIPACFSYAKGIDRDREIASSRKKVTRKEDFCTAELMETGKTAGTLRTRRSGLEHKKDVRAFSGHGEIVSPEKFYGTLEVRNGQSVRTPLSIMVYIHKADGKKRC